MKGDSLRKNRNAVRHRSPGSPQSGKAWDQNANHRLRRRRYTTSSDAGWIAIPRPPIIQIVQHLPSPQRGRVCSTNCRVQKIVDEEKQNYDADDEDTDLETADSAMEQESLFLSQLERFLRHRE